MEIIQEARKLLESSEPFKSLELALPIVENNNFSDDIKLDALHLIGEAYLENGDPQNAFKIFCKCAELDPVGAKGGLEKFLWLGQLSGGRDGLSWYEKGLNGLRKASAQLSNNTANDDLQHQHQKLINKKLGQALCGMIEIWMTDLCMEPEAESECEKYITEALMIDEDVPETWSMLGSIRISQQRDEDAREALERSWEVFQEFGEDSPDEVPSLIRLAQNMTEMGQFQYVLDITKRIHIIDDQVADSYYLNGLAHKEIYEEIMNSANADNQSRIAARHLAGARDAWELLLQLASVDDSEIDQELIINVKESLSTLPEVSNDDFSSSSEEEEEEDKDDDEPINLDDLDSDAEM